MKILIMQKLTSVINALNGIDVKGKQNLLNLGGCISVLEECLQDVNQLDEPQEDNIE